MIGIYRDKGEQAMEEERREKARRLSRYDEAIRLLRECGKVIEYGELDERVNAFLAAELKEGRG